MQSPGRGHGRCVHRWAPRRRRLGTRRDVAAAGGLSIVIDSVFHFVTPTSRPGAHREDALESLSTSFRPRYAPPMATGHHHRRRARPPASRSRPCPRSSTAATASRAGPRPRSSRSSTTSATSRAWSRAACARTAPTSSASWSRSSSRSAPRSSRAPRRRSPAPGYELLAYSGGGRAGSDVGWERRYLSRLRGTLIDGAILVTPTVVDADGHGPRRRDRPPRRPSGLPTVDSDNLAGAVLATEHLHRARAHPDRLPRRARRPGVLPAARGGLPARAWPTPGRRSTPTLVRVGGYQREGAAQPASALLTRPDRPTAIFAANDLSALGTMDVARELGLACPTTCRWWVRRRARVRADHAPADHRAPADPGMGAAAVELLIALMAGAGARRHARPPAHRAGAAGHHERR